MVVETAQTLERGVRILYLLAGTAEGLTVTELSRALGVSRTIIYRLAVTLESSALLRRGSDGRYRLGLGVLAIARQVQSVLRDAAMPTLRTLALDCMATAFLAVRDDDDMLMIAVAEPAEQCVHIARHVGHRSALRSSAAGLAISEATSETTGYPNGETIGETVSRSGGPSRPTHTLPEVKQSPLAAGFPGREIAAAIDVPGVEAAIGVLHLGPLANAAVADHVARAALDVSIGLR